MNQKKLYKIRQGKKLCGVCGGIAEYFEIDPTLVRILWIPFVFMGSLGFWVYIACAVIMPYKDEIGL